ncbi:hypothetical protein [Desulfolucanica intricata]|uniref:hypothetical protein n=1 Tax=Desulfolucanica intricata TaxID=1285191 RepID=UPI00082DA088|nr:hypothetical protein [Desulfolucanica intricata]
MYEKSLAWSRQTARERKYECCPEHPGYKIRHKKILSLLGEPEPICLLVPEIWFVFASYFNPKISEFLVTLTPEEWVKGKFETSRFSEWRNGFSPEERKEIPSSPRLGVMCEFWSKRFPELPGEAVLAALCVGRGKSELEGYLNIVCDPLSILEMGRGKTWRSCLYYRNSGRYGNDYTHDLSHRLWANLLDPGLALLVASSKPVRARLRGALARVNLRLARVYGKGKYKFGLIIDKWYGPEEYQESAFEFLFKRLKKAGMELWVPVGKSKVPYRLARQAEGDMFKVVGPWWECPACLELPNLDQKPSVGWEEKNGRVRLVGRVMRVPYKFWNKKFT